MMLARDPVRFTLDGRKHSLRPTLRAAMRLEASVGLRAALGGILNGNASTMCEVIRKTADLDHDLAAVLDAFGRPSLDANMRAFRDPLLALVLLMMGVDPDAEHKPTEAPTEPARPVSEVLAHLYRQATGWLGWTPDVALNATVAEVTEALAGRLELLSSIFGSGTSKAEPERVMGERDKHLDAKAKAIFGGLKQRFADRQKAA